MRFIELVFSPHIVRRALARRAMTERPKARVRGKSPRARLREDLLSILA